MYKMNASKYFKEAYVEMVFILFYTKISLQNIWKIGD